MLYPVELQSRLNVPKKGRKCTHKSDHPNPEVHPSIILPYFRVIPMKAALRYAFACWMLMAAVSEASAGVNYSELREVITDADRPVSERLEALEAYANELPPQGGEDFISYVNLFTQVKLTDDQYAVVTALKGKGLIQVGNPSQALTLLDSILANSADRDYSDRSLYRLYFERGRSQWRVRNQPNGMTKGLADFQEALEIAESLDDIGLQSRAHDAMANIHKQLKDDRTAIDHYSEILRNSDDVETIAQARYNIALSYAKDPITLDLSLNFMLEAREIFEQANLNPKVATATVSIASAYLRLKKHDEAKAEFERALLMGLGPRQNRNCFEYLGVIAVEQGEIDKAIDYYQTAIKLDREVRNNRQVYLFAKLGKAYIQKGESQRAILLCDSILTIALNMDGTSDELRATRLTDCYDCLYNAQFELGMYQASQRTRDLHDSAEAAYKLAFAKEKALANKQLFEYETLREEEKQLVVSKQKDDQRTLLIVIVLLLIAFAIFITSRYRFTRKQSVLISTQRQQLQDRQRELIHANAELEIALNHKAVFLSNMSHEIRTPLNAIVGMSNLASKEDMAEAARKYLRNIVIASSNLIDIVNDILDFSKLEAGKLEIAKEPFSVQDALEVAENVMRIPAEQKDLDFKVNAHAELPDYLMGDASRLNQVLINLIGNAIKFTLEGGVTLSAEVSPLPALPSWCNAPSKSFDQWFVVRVTDTGIGIPADKLEKIFESFNQGDQLKTRKFGGTGLGLSISKQIVELQGGVIWVESEDGKGSTFAFALPAQVSESDLDEGTEVIPETEIGPLRILIAEDNPFNVIVTEDTLNSELTDLTIGKAENGRIAFEKVRDEEWDLVLMDVHMPEMSGLEATSAIRKLPNDKADTLIIAMTASVLREETESYMRHGMNGFVPKPFQVEQLLSEIRRLRKGQKSDVPTKVELPPLRILIAEDNPFNVIVAEDTLRSELPEVTIGKAENGQVAFEAVRDGDWDIVLMDIAMPEMTGLEATAAIRKLPDETKAQTTIIAMTASVLKEETDHYLKQGMNGFVPKPFKVEQLLGEIARAHASNS